MNKARRAVVSAAISAIEGIIESVEKAAEEEREVYDNMPEGLQSSERGEQACAAADALESAHASLGEALDYLGEIEL